VKTIDPKSSFADIGFGVISLYKFELPAARAAFEKILAKEPHNERAKAFLSLSCLLSAMREKTATTEQIALLERAAKLAKEVESVAQQSSTRSLAQSILDWQKELQVKVKA
jgi:hypothetical protein